jgi:glycosyltransferase involved in cell wall biosynthesis
VNAEIICSSRELFGADRCALRLAELLDHLGIDVHLTVPADRPELGLAAEAARRGIAYQERSIAIASSGGIEAPLAALPRRHSYEADLTIFNSTAVVGSLARVEKKVVIVREWLDPHSIRHRLLVGRHRIGADAVVGISSDVISQWRACMRGPRHQFLVSDWLERDFLDGVRVSTRDAEADGDRKGILCIGRFNSWKGQEVLADAYELAFASAHARPPLKFVGAQPGTMFADRAEALKSRGEIWGWEVLPFTADPAEHFKRAALVVVPSLKPEPFGMVILEALAYGCRVLAFEGGGPSDLAGFFPGAVQAIARSTQNLAEALAAWAGEGRADLSATQRADVWRGLDLHYSPEARTEAWQTIIELVSR